MSEFFIHEMGPFIQLAETRYEVYLCVCVAMVAQFSLMNIHTMARSIISCLIYSSYALNRVQPNVVHKAIGLHLDDLVLWFKMTYHGWLWLTV